MTDNNLLLKWVCKLCKKKAEYNAFGNFLCSKHWEAYIDNPDKYLKKLKVRKKK